MHSNANQYLQLYVISVDIWLLVLDIKPQLVQYYFFFKFLLSNTNIKSTGLPDLSIRLHTIPVNFTV